MNKKDIVNALKSRLDDGAIGPVAAWPNVDFSGAHPYFLVMFPDANRTGNTLKGDELVTEVGLMSVVVVTELDKGEDAANGYADAVADLFPEGHLITITDGQITILKPADIRGGYRDEADWKVPVIIRYSARSN